MSNVTLTAADLSALGQVAPVGTSASSLAVRFPATPAGLVAVIDAINAVATDASVTGNSRGGKLAPLTGRRNTIIAELGGPKSAIAAVNAHRKSAK